MIFILMIIIYISGSIKADTIGKSLSVSKLRLILNDYLEYRNELETDSNKVFVDEYRGENTESHFNKMIKRAAKKAGLDANISSHIMRHSFSSNLIAKGVDIVKVKKLLGHEKIETTNIYLHTNMHLLRNAIDKL